MRGERGSLIDTNAGLAEDYQDATRYIRGSIGRLKIVARSILVGAAEKIQAELLQEVSCLSFSPLAHCCLDLFLSGAAHKGAV